MALIPATKIQQVQTIKQVTDAARMYGYDNVTCEYWNTIIRKEESKNSIQPDLYLEVLTQGNEATVQALLNAILSSNAFRVAAAAIMGIAVQDLENKLVQMCIERNVNVSGVPVSTSLENLNTMAEAKLLDLYNVERTESIDLAFVEKYHEQMDLYNLARVTKNREILDFVKEQMQKDEVEYECDEEDSDHEEDY